MLFLTCEIIDRIKLGNKYSPKLCLLNQKHSNDKVTILNDVLATITKL